jgi:hypothetical protein
MYVSTVRWVTFLYLQVYQFFIHCRVSIFARSLDFYPADSVIPHRLLSVQLNTVRVTLNDSDICAVFS